ncbi:hypothetical protein [Endozoicomonas arenosclerae]|uniref:hypothetical protein n=1 Tax=Endozoicomonas arenosclerae TaxID=1633495 RepID=UPI000A411EDE|nr:hypothetical protein [Endozoicomonas arenosclerae]
MKTLSLSLVGHVGFFSKEFNDRLSLKSEHNKPSEKPSSKRRQALNQLCQKKDIF